MSEHYLFTSRSTQVTHITITAREYLELSLNRYSGGGIKLERPGRVIGNNLSPRGRRRCHASVDKSAVNTNDRRDRNPLYTFAPRKKAARRVVLLYIVSLKPPLKISAASHRGRHGRTKARSKRKRKSVARVKNAGVHLDTVIETRDVGIKSGRRVKIKSELAAGIIVRVIPKIIIEDTVTFLLHLDTVVNCNRDVPR